MDENMEEEVSQSKPLQDTTNSFEERKTKEQRIKENFQKRMNRIKMMKQ